MLPKGAFYNTTLLELLLTKKYNQDDPKVKKELDQNMRMMIMRFKEGMKPREIAKIEKVHVLRVYRTINRLKSNIKRL